MFIVHCFMFTVMTISVPEPIVTKFGLGAYVSDVSPHANIQTDCPSGGILAKK